MPRLSCFSDLVMRSTPESKAQEDTAALLVRAWLAVGGFTATSLEKASMGIV